MVTGLGERRAVFERRGAKPCGETDPIESTSILRRSAAEAVGTFALVFAGTGAVVANDLSGGAVTHVGVAIVFGLVVTAMIYAVGDTSGAHLNPAVTLGFYAAGRFPARDVPAYAASQFIGALLASLAVRFVLGEHPTLGATIPSGGAGQSFVLEILLTFLLMFVILCVAIGAKEKGVMAGVAIGATVALEAMFAGPICGASMNPARSFGPAVVSLDLRFVWLYTLAPVLGAALAVPVWRFIRDPDAAVTAGEPGKAGSGP